MKWPWRKKPVEQPCVTFGVTLSPSNALFTTEPWVRFQRKEPAMSVKVEKIEPKPQNKFALCGISSMKMSDRQDVEPTPVFTTESEARAIWEGLAEHFGWPEVCLKLKDAEIARLKLSAAAGCSWAHYYKMVAEFESEIARYRAWLKWSANPDTDDKWEARALAGEKVPD